MESFIEKTVHLEQPDTLSGFISEKERMTLRSLKITGKLGEQDVLDVLDDMCWAYGTFDEYDDFTLNEEESPKLKILDMGDCTYCGGVDFPYFGYITQLQKIVFPKGIRCCIDNIGNESGFADSETLTTVVFPEGMVRIDGFSNCVNIKDVTIPDSVREFGNYAFCGTSISSIRLSKNVEVISGASFSHTLIEKFEMDALNPNFTIIDGVIFTKDKTRLIAYPGSSLVRDYVIPDGTKVIAKNAFYGGSIKSISFPDSLEIIEEYAFNNCPAELIPTSGESFTISIPNEGKTRLKRFNWRWCDSRQTDNH